MVNSKPVLTWLALTAFLLAPFGSSIAEDLKANQKRGRVYFKMVCTVCHIQTAVKTIPPSSRTMAEWRAYFDANKHDATGKTQPEVRYYVSQEYRVSIQDKNKAAKKFLKLSNEQIYADVREFAVSGAKDSDTPASCN